MDSQAFNPISKTYAVLAEETPALAVDVSAMTTSNNYRVYNSGDVDIWFSFGKTESEALGNCIVPNVGSPQLCFPIPPGTIEVFTGPEKAFVAVRTNQDTALVYITEGRGM